MRLASTELRDFLTGLILGDGSIDKGVHNRAFSIKNAHEDFIRYIESTLRENTQFKIRVDHHDAEIKNGISRKEYWQLTVSSHPYFAKKYHNFYNDMRKRRVPKETLSWLSPLGIANWWMSDGYIVRVGATSGTIKHRRVELATDRYKESDVDKIIEYFNNTFQLNCVKVKRKNGVYRVRFSLISSQYLFLLMKDFIVDSYKYKLDLCYDYQPDWMCNEYYNLMLEIRKCRPPDLEEILEGEDIV